MSLLPAEEGEVEEEVVGGEEEAEEEVGAADHPQEGPPLHGALQVASQVTQSNNGVQVQVKEDLPTPK